MPIKTPAERGLKIAKVKIVHEGQWFIEGTRHITKRMPSQDEYERFYRYRLCEEFYAWCNWSKLLGLCPIEPATAADWENQ